MQSLPVVIPDGTDQRRECQQYVSVDDRRHLEAIERERRRSRDEGRIGETWDEIVARLDAQADPATIAALDALATADEPDDVTTVRVEEYSGGCDTRPSCPDQIVRTKTTLEGVESVTEVVRLNCERRACPVCGLMWAETKAMNVHANFADAAEVRVIDIDAADWNRVRQSIARSASDPVYVKVPAEDGRVLIITDAPISDGNATTAAAAVVTIEKALHRVAERCADGKEPAVTTSRNFVQHAAVRARGKADPEAVYGTLTKLDSRRPLSEALTDIAPDGVTVSAVIVDRDADLSQATTYRLRGGPLAMQLALKRGGWISDAEAQARRVEAKAMRRFEDEQRAIDRRHAPETERRRRATIEACAAERTPVAARPVAA